MHELPAGAPATLKEAFQHIAALDNPSMDDLKVMVLVEAAGLRLYQDLASGGREEAEHGARLMQAADLLAA